MKPVHYAMFPRRRRVAIVAGSITAAAVIAAGVLAVSMYQETPRVPTAAGSTGVTVAAAPVVTDRFDSAAVFAERVQPVLRELDTKNAVAVQNAIARIHGHFDRARGGAPEFADAIIGPLDGAKTTYLAGKGVFMRWWYEDATIQPVANHVRWNYEQHVTSGPKIRDAVLAAIMQLQQDFRANRNEALQEIGSNLRAANLPVTIQIDQKQLDEFCQCEFDAAMASINADHVAQKAAFGSDEALVVSQAAWVIANRAITYVLSDSVSAAGGTVVAATAGGAAAGTEVPVVGNAIGTAVGLLAGTAVDMWLSHRNKAQTINEVTNSLTQIESSILRGDSRRAGIQQMFACAESQQSTQLESKLKQQLKEAAQ